MDCVDDFQSYKMAAVDTAAANYKLYHIYLLLSREKLVLQRSFAALRMTGIISKCLLVRFHQGIVSISASPSVIATVCSKCAELLPSTVTTVQSSARTRVSFAPIMTMGSMAITMPGFSV